MNLGNNNFLRELTKDARDFLFSKVVGSIPVEDVPQYDFLVAVPLEIKNQDINYSSDFCAAYASVEVREDQVQVTSVPEWTFAWAKKLLADKSGDQTIYDQFGINLRDAGLAISKKGILPRIYDPFACDTTNRPPRAVISRIENWGNLEDKAVTEPCSFLFIDGEYDMFDNIRVALWRGKGLRQSIVTGAYWRFSWNTPTGIIPKQYEPNGSPHAFKFCGQKTINGELHLVAQLSDGDNFGDKGFFYFPREVVNKEIGKFGNVIFVPIHPDKILYNLTKGIQLYDSSFKKAWKIISSYIRI